jgi:lipopolysaccharide biosynthesis glycosyltransferase
MGYDPATTDSYMAALRSVTQFDGHLPVIPLVLSNLRKMGVYTRPHDPMASTEFAHTRFLVPYLNHFRGWALFVDSDVIFLEDPARLFELADPRYAVQVVKHDYTPLSDSKMDGKVQTVYPRKNWSSVMLWNCAHPGARELTPEFVNAPDTTWADLHRFSWLSDGEIGELPLEWNWLVGYYQEPQHGKPKLLHYTDGTPQFESSRNCEYADIWQGFSD